VSVNYGRNESVKSAPDEAGVLQDVRGFRQPRESSRRKQKPAAGEFLPKCIVTSGLYKFIYSLVFARSRKVLLQYFEEEAKITFLGAGHTVHVGFKMSENVLFFSIYFTQIRTMTLRIKLQRTTSSSMYKVLKAWHPREIRTHNLLLRWLRR
jgi:hypothetical protein